MAGKSKVGERLGCFRLLEKIKTPKGAPTYLGSCVVCGGVYIKKASEFRRSGCFTCYGLRRKGRLRKEHSGEEVNGWDILSYAGSKEISKGRRLSLWRGQCQSCQLNLVSSYNHFRKHRCLPCVNRTKSKTARASLVGTIYKDRLITGVAQKIPSMKKLLYPWQCTACGHTGYSTLSSLKTAACFECRKKMRKDLYFGNRRKKKNG